MHHYLVSYVGDGTDREPFRPEGSDQPGWAAIDLRPDVTRLDGFALLALPVREDRAERRYLGDTLDEPSVTTRQELESWLSITLVATRLREQIAELLIEERSGSRWKPLRPTRRGVYEIHLGGRIYERPILRGGITITESFDQADSTTIGPDLTWTELLNNSRTLSNKWAVGTSFVLYEARADSDLDTDDHYAQALVELDNSGAVTPNIVGVLARQREVDATRTHYGWRYLSANTGVTRELYRRASGTLTTLAGPTASTVALDDLIRLECTGSTITGKLNGVTEEEVTDTNITGNLRCGVTGQRVSAGTVPKLDTFEAGDLAAGVSLTPAVAALAAVGIANASITDTRLMPTRA